MNTSPSIPVDRPLRVGVLGTSWWADSMYLPALDGHPDVEIAGLCGRCEAPARELAATWNVDWVSTDVDEFLDPERLDAVVVATSNDSHEPITLSAFEFGIERSERRRRRMVVWIVESGVYSSLLMLLYCVGSQISWRPEVVGICAR